ncbi:MAG TPA: SH3 domain-containing protein, partial [Gemmatimonadales bacterium]
EKRRAESAATVPTATPATAPPPPPADTLPHVILRKGATVAAGPGGASVGSFAAALPAQVTARSGDWVRIRTEGWVRKEDVRPAVDSAGVTLEQLRTEPDKYVGQGVVWRLQYIALQIADELRPELAPGEPYVLARGPLPEAGFVYVAVTREQAGRFREMSPLDEFTANGTIRSARTRYLPTPVIELRRTP